MSGFALRVGLVLVAAIFAAIAPAAGTAVAGEPATGSVRGNVEVLRRSLFGGLKQADDRSGVVVYVTGFTRVAPKPEVLLSQRKQRFEPRILPVVQGQSVAFPNLDRIYHNVFSVSPLATFDLGQYKSTDAPRTVTFERAGLVPVYCNIHPQMLSYVVVLENDAYAATEADGRFAIDGIPRGADLTLNAWAPGAKRVSQPLRIDVQPAADVQLRIEQTEGIEPHKRKDGSEYPPPPSYDD
jgi:plastocyanin